MVEILNARHVTARFPGRRGGPGVCAPRDFSLSVQAGEILGLAGASGCGKSAFAAALLGLLERPGCVVSGVAVFRPKNGPPVDLLALAERELEALRGREIGMIFQDPVSSLHPSRKIRTQFAETLRGQNPALSGGERREIAREALGRMMFAEPDKILASYPFELSGGMCQRVSIALSLVLQPRLLIADEPTTALDVKNQAQVLRLIRETRDRTGMAVVLISHDIGVISAAADRAIQMQAPSP